MVFEQCLLVALEVLAARPAGSRGLQASRGRFFGFAQFFPEANLPANSSDQSFGFTVILCKGESPETASRILDGP